MTRCAFFVTLLLVVSISLSSCGQRSQVPQSSDVADQAKQFVDLLAEGDFSTAAGTFDRTMKAAMTPEKLKEAWASLTGTLGTLQEQTAVRTTTEQGYDTAHVSCKFEQGSAVIKVVFDSTGEVCGLWFLPPE